MPSARKFRPRHPFREWNPHLQIGRAYRPGYNSEQLITTPDSVRDWILRVKALGVRSVISLLSEAELRWYGHLPGGLLGSYQSAGLEAFSLPVPMDIPGVLTRNHLEQLDAAFDRLPRPLVIHCSAGLVRSRAAVDHLAQRISQSTPIEMPCMDPEILRRIRNSKREHGSCALRTGAYGLDDYGILGHLLKTVPNSQLPQYLDEIDLVRHTHKICLPCSLKFLAFCRSFSDGRLPERCARYSAEFEKLLPAYPGNRDFMDEIRRAIKTNRPVLGPKSRTIWPEPIGWITHRGD